MNAAPLPAPNLAGANARSQGARADSNAAADSGFAALFAQLEPAITQAEPTALPAVATGLAQEPVDPVEVDGPDPALLAALGLAPLPPPPALAGLSVFSISATSGAMETSGTESPSEDGARAALPAPLANRSGIDAGALNPASAWAQARIPLTSVPPTTVEALPGAGAEGAIDGIDALSVNPRTLPLPNIATSNAAERAPVNAEASALASAARAAGPMASASIDPEHPGALRSSDLPADMPAPPAASNSATPAAPRPAADFSAAAGAAQAKLAASSASFSEAAVGVADAESGDSAALLAGAGRAEGLLSARRGDSGSTVVGALQAAAIGAERAELASAVRESLMPMLAVMPGARVEPGSPQFSATLSQQMLWMASQQVSRAELKLSPDELGPLEISLEMNGDEIRAEFASRSADVRSLLETQIPRLRELLAEQGFSLADAQVGQERAAYQDAPQQREGFAAGRGKLDDTAAAAESGTSAPVLVRARQGLVDDYA